MKMVKPSEELEEQWLFAHRIGLTKRKYKYIPHSTKGGKWLIFVSKDKLDSVWNRIKRATVLGRLGKLAKVSTMKESPYASSRNQKVVCVYCDTNEESKILDMREKLRKMGFKHKLSFKPNEATILGLYSTNGDHRISRYYC